MTSFLTYYKFELQSSIEKKQLIALKLFNEIDCLKLIKESLNSDDCEVIDKEIICKQNLMKGCWNHDTELRLLHCIDVYISYINSTLDY